MTRRKRSQIVTTSKKSVAEAARSAIMPVGKIEQAILLVRGEKVILDADLGELYGVATRVLNQAVKRNRDRFPEDFMFQLTWEEAKGLRSQSVTLDGQDGDSGSRSQFVTLKRGGNIKYRPYAFTEHGAIMAATVLNSPRAVQVSVFVVRAFVRLRRMLAQNKELAANLAELQGKLEKHDRQIIALIDAIRELMAPPPEAPSRKIGFQSEAGA